MFVPGLPPVVEHMFTGSFPIMLFLGIVAECLQGLIFQRLRAFRLFSAFPVFLRSEAKHKIWCQVFYLTGGKISALCMVAFVRKRPDAWTR